MIIKNCKTSGGERRKYPNLGRKLTGGREELIEEQVLLQVFDWGAEVAAAKRRKGRRQGRRSNGNGWAGGI